MEKDEFEFELAKKQTEVLLLIAKELCNIRQVLEDIAESSNIIRQAAITGFYTKDGRVWRVRGDND